MLSQPRRFRLPAFAALLLLLITFVFGSLPSAGTAAPEDEHHPKAAKHNPAVDAKHDAAHDEHAEHHHEPNALEHTMDSTEIHLFHTPWLPQTIHLPAIPLPFGYHFQITKFMLLEVLAAVLVALIYLWVARRVETGQPPSGPLANAFEVLLVFIRDQIAKPNLGEHVADRYVPFLWTLFLFILFNNLLGMFPFLGSATASLSVTVALAVIVFFAIHGSAIMAMGTAAGHGHGHDDGHGHHTHDAHGHHEHTVPATGLEAFCKGTVRYVKSLWPHIDVPFPMGLIIKPLVFFIEIVGILVRNLVLAVRLFANMFAGHMVLATILIFIYMARAAHPALWGVITGSSVLGIIALSLLELFVAFLQAYIFTFLTSLFMGMAIHPQH
jgi:F-type H+-transporting ATPase subunit a